MKHAVLFYRRHEKIIVVVLISLMVTLLVSTWLIKDLREKERLSKLAEEEKQMAFHLYDNTNQKYYKLSDHYEKALFENSLDLMKKKDFKGAISMVEKALEFNPRNRAYWYHHGNLKVSTLDFESAIKSFHQAGYSGGLTDKISRFVPIMKERELNADEFKFIFDHLNGTPLKERILFCHGRTSESRKAHAEVVYAYLQHLNPDWVDRSFEYDSTERSLSIGGQGFSNLNGKDRGQTLLHLKLIHLSLRDTDVSQLQSLSPLPISSLDISGCPIHSVKWLRKVATLTKVILGSGQMSEDEVGRIPSRIEVVIR
jgi:tetratricopeptide (TPR) repeat protein